MDSLKLRYWILQAMLSRAKQKFCRRCAYLDVCWTDYGYDDKFILANCRNNYIKAIVKKILEIINTVDVLKLALTIDEADIYQTIEKKLKYP